MWLDDPDQVTNYVADIRPRQPRRNTYDCPQPSPGGVDSTQADDERGRPAKRTRFINRGKTLRISGVFSTGTCVAAESP